MTNRHFEVDAGGGVKVGHVFGSKRRGVFLFFLSILVVEEIFTYQNVGIRYSTIVLR